MAVPQLLPPGKAVRFWTRLEDLPPIFFGPIAREIGLCWLSYDKDGSVYTGARFTASEIDSPAGLLAGEDMTVQKISIHGSGKILGPDRHLESARRTEDHLGFPIIGLTHRAQICKHLVGNAGTYITEFDTRTHRRPTDLFLKGVLEEHGLFVLSIEVAPAGSNTSEDQAAWTTKPLVNGEPMLIIANLAFYAEEVRPDAHQILAPRG